MQEGAPGRMGCQCRPASFASIDDNRTCSLLMRSVACLHTDSPLPICLPPPTMIECYEPLASRWQGRMSSGGPRTPDTVFDPVHKSPSVISAHEKCPLMPRNPLAPMILKTYTNAGSTTILVDCIVVRLHRCLESPFGHFFPFGLSVLRRMQTTNHNIFSCQSHHTFDTNHCVMPDLFCRT